MASPTATSRQAPQTGARRLIAVNFLSLSAGQVVIFISSFISGIYSRRVLGATVIGEVAWTLSVLSYFTLVINPGLDTIAQRDVAREPERSTEYVSRMLFLKLLLAAGSFGLVGLVAALKLRGAEISLLLVLQGLGLLLVPLNVSWLLMARERMGAQTVCNCVFQLLQLPALFLLVRGPSHVVRYVLYPYPFTLAAALVIFWYAGHHQLMNWRSLRMSLQGTLSLIREAIPVGLSQAAILLYFNSAAIFLGFLRDNATVGFYSTAYRLWTYAAFPFSALSQAYFPSLARAAMEPDSQRRTSSEYARAMLWFGLPVSAVCWALGRHVVQLLFGSEFAPSGPMFEWLSLNVALSSFTWAITFPLNAWGHQKETLYITVLAAVVNVGLNFAIIPRYGAPGAVATTLAAELVVLVTGVVVRRRICPLPWARLSWRPLLTSVIVAALVRWLVVMAPTYWWMGLVVGGAVCVICLGLLERRIVTLLVEKIKVRYQGSAGATGSQ